MRHGILDAEGVYAIPSRALAAIQHVVLVWRDRSAVAHGTRGPGDAVESDVRAPQRQRDGNRDEATRRRPTTRHQLRGVLRLAQARRRGRHGVDAPHDHAVVQQAHAHVWARLGECRVQRLVVVCGMAGGVERSTIPTMAG